MPRPWIFFGLALLAVGTLVPALEALAPCEEQCLDEGPGSRCAADQCCSCCVHARLVKGNDMAPAEPLSRSSLMQVAHPGFPPAVDPREILHIPKPTFA